MKSLFLKNKMIILYLFFGICTTLINTICYYILYEYIKIDNILSTIIAWLVAVLFAFFTNKFFVFASKRSKRRERIHEFLSFFICRILTGILDVIIMFLAVNVLDANNLLWKLISNIIVTIINYIVSKFIVFNKIK